MTLSCCWDTCCFASGASQLCTVTISNPNVVSVGECKCSQSTPLHPKLMSNGRKNALSDNLAWSCSIGLGAKAWRQLSFSPEELGCILKLMLQSSATSAEAGSFELKCMFTFCMSKNKVAVSALALPVFIYICPRTERGIGTAPKVTGV